MLKEALKIIEGKEIETLKQRVGDLTKSVKKMEPGTARKGVEKEIETLRAKMKKMGHLEEAETPPEHEWNEGPDRSNNPSLQVLRVIDGMKSMLGEMKSHLKWERKEESKLMKKGAGSREHEKELLYYEQQIDLMEGMINQLQTAVADMQKVEKKAGMVNESMGMSDEVAAKKIAAKIKGTPNLNIATIEKFVTKYLGAVGKAPTDVKHLTALVHSELEDMGMLGETVSVTDYNPKSQGGTRKELLQKFAETKDPKYATAARKAGATQKELQDAKNQTVKESIKLIQTVKDDAKGTEAKVYHMTGADDRGDPYMVKLFKKGKHQQFADYFTDDKNDAFGTAKHMIKESTSGVYTINKKKG